MGLAEVIKARLLSWGNSLDLSGWAQWDHTGLCKRKRKVGVSKKLRVTTVAEIGVMRVCEPRMVGSL